MTNHPAQSSSLLLKRFWLALLLALLIPVARAEAPAPTVAAAKYEVRFMQDMIHHHMMAVHMAQMCLAKAVHAELKTLCSQIITTQTAEIQQMQAWLATWYGIDSHMPMTMMPGHEKQMQHLASLSGAQFEIAFMREMIRHHRGAIVEASHCLQRAYHDELIALCENIVETQLEEIQLMQQWLCSWYGYCRRQNL